MLEAILRPTTAGGKLEYSHRLTDGLSLQAQAWGAMSKDPLRGWQPDYGVSAGLTWRF